MLSADSADAKDEEDKEDKEEGDGFDDEEDVPGAENTISDNILIVWDPTISDLW